jgi:hypothetical protein
MKHAKINWSPFATNVLDAGDYDLCKPDGTPVDMHQDSRGGFVLVVDGRRYETDDNIQMSYWMNQFEIGGIRKPSPCASCEVRRDPEFCNPSCRDWPRRS